MASLGLSQKRSQSTLESPDTKRPKQHYHHHHRLHEPLAIPVSSEPALQNDANVDDLMDRSIGRILKDTGFDHADPAALQSLRLATDTYLSKISKHICESMLASRRIQPIPPDFEHALTRIRLSLNDLHPLVKTPQPVAKISILPPSPPPEDELARNHAFLTALRGEESETNRSYVPKNFPDFPSKHTYSATPVFTERDNDPRKIREQAADDGRHGEEALRRLASAAHRDNPTNTIGRDKKPWGRKMESMESMFEKTVKGLSKRIQKEQKDPAAPPLGTAMDIDLNPEAEAKARTKGLLSIEMGPIVNCERHLWRRPASGPKGEEKSLKPAPPATEVVLEETTA
ncbi:hypothetical protein N7468_009594 [Penicillium chermesinum]|uniref:Transcription initiation factor TFIID subunit 8 n=1 Tax=Penicillium chermesinum TaxID=63820 RepID=A0A9W9NI41_9EURO|nr:uncharacterized protein N7468_009594 [Penicillium chermesinum]KAJ5220390.1 hypothetical protein N7468_009594 [Penicillium chermesinum]